MAGYLNFDSKHIWCPHLVFLYLKFSSINRNSKHMIFLIKLNENRIIKV